MSNRNIYGGYTATSGNADGNSVGISGTVDGNVYGGRANTSGGASGNSVDFSGNLIFAGGYITGGYARIGNAVNNSVTIRQSAVLPTDAGLRGGVANAGYDAFSGNKLTVEPRSLALAYVNGFEHYELALPAGFSSGGTLITVTSGAVWSTILNNPLNESQLAKFTIHADNADPLKKAGDYFTVISNTDMVTSGQKYQSTATGLRGIGVQYTYNLENQSARLPGSPEALIATITGVDVNPQTRSMTHVSTGPAVFLNQGADFIVNQGIDAALGATAICPDGNCGDGRLPVRVFALSGVNKTRQKAGGHVDVEGLNLMGGLSLGNDSCELPLTLALFIEYGDGDYDSHADISRDRNVDGKGDLSYFGGGILGKAEQLFGGLYVEGSFRYGRYESEFRNSDFYVPSYLGGTLPKFDIDGDYYGAHAGLGYVFGLEDMKLDTSVKYLWTRLEGDSVDVLGDRFRFNDLDSHRLQTGARLMWNLEEHMVAPYVGARYEYEFDGEASGSVQGFSLPETDMKGSTGIFDAGIKVGGQDAVSFDLGLTGTIGQRQSLGGHASVSWDF